MGVVDTLAEVVRRYAARRKNLNGSPEHLSKYGVINPAHLTSDVVALAKLVVGSNRDENYEAYQSAPPEEGEQPETRVDHRTGEVRTVRPYPPGGMLPVSRPPQPHLKPILADALMDAGFNDQPFLDFLRDPDILHSTRFDNHVRTMANPGDPIYGASQAAWNKHVQDYAKVADLEDAHAAALKYIPPEHHGKLKPGFVEYHRDGIGSMRGNPRPGQIWYRPAYQSGRWFHRENRKEGRPLTAEEVRAWAQQQKAVAERQRQADQTQQAEGVRNRLVEDFPSQRDNLPFRRLPARVVRFAKAERQRDKAHPLVANFPLEFALRKLANDPAAGSHTREFAKTALTGGPDARGDLIPPALFYLHDTLQDDGHPAQAWYNWMSASDKVRHDEVVHRALQLHADAVATGDGRTYLYGEARNYPHTPEGAAESASRAIGAARSPARHVLDFVKHQAKRIDPTLDDKQIEESVRRHAHRARHVWASQPSQHGGTLAPSIAAAYEAESAADLPHTFLADGKQPHALNAKAARYARLRKLFHRGKVRRYSSTIRGLLATHAAGYHVEGGVLRDAVMDTGNPLGEAIMDLAAARGIPETVAATGFLHAPELTHELIGRRRPEHQNFGYRVEVGGRDVRALTSGSDLHVWPSRYNRNLALLAVYHPGGPLDGPNYPQHLLSAELSPAELHGLLPHVPEPHRQPVADWLAANFPSAAIDHENGLPPEDQPDRLSRLRAAFRLRYAARRVVPMLSTAAHLAGAALDNPDEGTPFMMLADHLGEQYPSHPATEAYLKWVNGAPLSEVMPALRGSSHSGELRYHGPAVFGDPDAVADPRIPDMEIRPSNNSLASRPTDYGGHEPSPHATAPMWGRKFGERLWSPRRLRAPGARSPHLTVPVRGPRVTSHEVAQAVLDHGGPLALVRTVIAARHWRQNNAAQHRDIRPENIRFRRLRDMLRRRYAKKPGVVGRLLEKIAKRWQVTDRRTPDDVLAEHGFDTGPNPRYATPPGSRPQRQPQPPAPGTIRMPRIVNWGPGVNPGRPVALPQPTRQTGRVSTPPPAAPPSKLPFRVPDVARPSRVAQMVPIADEIIGRSNRHLASLSGANRNLPIGRAFGYKLNPSVHADLSAAPAIQTLPDGRTVHLATAKATVNGQTKRYVTLGLRGPDGRLQHTGVFGLRELFQLANQGHDWLKPHLERVGRRGGFVGTAKYRRGVRRYSSLKTKVLRIGHDFPDELYHGTIVNSANAFAKGQDLPDEKRSKTYSEFGNGVIYASEAENPQQALMFSNSRGTKGKRVLTALKLKPGGTVLDLSPHMTRRPAVFSSDTPVLKITGRPPHTDDMIAWLKELRAGKGAEQKSDDWFSRHLDPTHPDFDTAYYATMLPSYAKARGHAAIRLADETLLLDRSAITGARRVGDEERKRLEENSAKGSARRTKHSLFTDEPNKLARLRKLFHRGRVRRYLKPRNDFIDALRRVRSSDNVALKQSAAVVASKLGLDPVHMADALSDAAHGSVPGVVSAIYGRGRPEDVHQLAAWMGLQSNAPGIGVFHVRPGGGDRLHKFEQQGSGLDIRQKLDRAGIKQRVILPKRNSWVILVPDAGGQQYARVRDYASRHGLPLQSSAGYFKSVGAADRGDARAKYRDRIVAGESGKSSTKNSQIPG